ncbi:MAG TPA: hypothetical protein VEH01_04210, partial [Nitrososphaerales archaeon]|nr:hypothetical protein [Nitrososphaerales archaeon]
MPNKLVAAGLLLVAISIMSGVVLQQREAAVDPCDGYGDCLSGSITYLRANPGNSLYLGDSFQ